MRRSQTIEASAKFELDEHAAEAYVSFHGEGGEFLDGSTGVDSMLTGFAHNGAQRALSPRYAPLLALVAEHGGRWHPGKGFAVREEAVPDLIRAIRALPKEVSAVEGDNVARLKVSGKPVQVVERVNLVDDERLEQETVLLTPDGATVEPSAVLPQTGKSGTRQWVRSGDTYFRAPSLTGDEVRRIAEQPRTSISGDDVPFFLAKQLARLQRERIVVPNGRASEAFVDAASQWMTDVTVELSSAGRLRMGVGFLAGTRKISWEQADRAKGRRYVQTAKDVWVAQDQEVQQHARGALNKIPDVRPLESAGQYDVPAQALPYIQEAFSATGTIRLDHAAEEFRRQLMDFEGIRDYEEPNGLAGTLRPYQKIGYNWLRFLHQYGLGGVLADDMGLGKTIQCLATVLAAHEAGEDGASLVVCPASVVGVWQREIARWAPALRPVVLARGRRERFLRAPTRGAIGIVSYNALASGLEEFTRTAWNFVILDEAHRIKNPSTAQTKACKVLLAKHKIAVTGTPVQNRLADLWSIFDFLMQGYLGKASEFTAEFEVPITHAGDEAAANRLKRRIDPFKLRRTKRDVARDLPELTQQVVSLPLMPRQRELYEQLVRDEAGKWLEELKGDPAAQIGVLEKLLRLRQVAAHPSLIDPTIGPRDTASKFERCVELLEEALSEGRKVLIFSQFAGICQLMREHLDSLQPSVRYSVLTGATTMPARDRVVEEFQRPDGPSVMIISLKAGGEGLTLTAADTVILYDRWWNPAVEEQAIARAHRIGQKMPVTAYILEAKDTIEERLADLLRRKRDLSSSVVSVDLAEKRITREDLLELLQQEIDGATREQEEYPES